MHHLSFPRLLGRTHTLEFPHSHLPKHPSGTFDDGVAISHVFESRLLVAAASMKSMDEAVAWGGGGEAARCRTLGGRVWQWMFG